MRRFLLGFFAGIAVMTIPIGWAFHRASFFDVPHNAWYSEAVADMKSRGLFDGYPDGSFRPANYVNRAELAVVLQQLLKNIEGEEIAQSTVSFASPSSQPQPQPSSSSSPVYNTVYETPFSDSLAFINTQLSSSSGAVFSNLQTNISSSSVVGVNHEVVSESYGLLFNALAEGGKKDEFEKSYQFFKRYILSDRNLAYWKLKEDLTPYGYANATIDDLKIIKGLLRGFEKFGTAAYRDTALAMGQALKQHGLRNGVLTSSISWDSNGTYADEHLILGYADFEAMKKLQSYDQEWKEIRKKTIEIVKNGRLESRLFSDRYNFSTGQYESDASLHMIFQAYVSEHLMLGGEWDYSKKLLKFMKDEFTRRGKIFGRYTAAGQPAVNYEDLAVYAIAARAALLADDKTFAQALIDKILDLQIKNASSPRRGAFLWSENEIVYAFSQLNALYTIALFRNTNLVPQPFSAPSGDAAASGIPPSPPGPPPVITDQNFVLWHMSDIYYGSHHNRDLTTMVNDMDTIAWNDALIAGDISGNGSAENFQAMKNIFMTESNHPWSAFHFLAGNHEYQCGEAPEQGCLDNYKSIITANLRYTFDRGNIHFIVMSTDDGKYKLSDATMAWLRSEIAQNQNKIIALATHQMPHAFEGMDQILNEFGIDLWLFGHAHCKHGDPSCTRHGAFGDFYQQAETTFVDAGYIGNMESRYLIFTNGSNQARILSRNHKNAAFQSQHEHTVTLRYPFSKN
ncbi:S-layer homology domain-containing protein [Candidatus Peregrinibacteria bacterium]|nr:S-layer homology domain-containing protein [Candidatus Peregrinibacteria bacterium]